MGSITRTATGLQPHHLAELRDGSGISPEVIAQRGAYTETDPEKLKALGFAPYQVLAPALVLPLHTLNGHAQTYAIKPDHPRQERKPDGRIKQIKYEYPAGASNRLDVPPACRDKVLDASRPLIFTEGWKKGDAAASKGLAVVVLGGVWNWRTRGEDGESRPISCLDYIPLAGRKVGICYDSDVLQNENVRKARERFADELHGRGAIPYYITLPPGPNGEKVGLDDYLLTHEAWEVWALAEPAFNPEASALQAENRELRRTATQATATRTRVLYALRNKHIKAERMPLVATAMHLEHKHESRERYELPGKGGGWCKVPRDAIAEQAGCSPKTAGTHLDTGAKWGLYEKTVDFDPDRRVDPDTGEILPPTGHKNIFLRRVRPLSETLDLLAAINPEKEKAHDWGGNRPMVCEDHPEAGTVKRWSLHCQECDRLLDEGETFKRPEYQDDTYPDKHADELVPTVPTPTAQDDLPRLSEGLPTPTLTPMGQDDPRPPAFSRELTGLPMFAPAPKLCTCCEDPAFCTRLGRCPFAEHLRPQARAPEVSQ